MSKYILLVSLLFLSYRLKATHIVGGEFELIHQQGYKYKLNMIMYFDHVNGTPEAEDFIFIAHIFSKKGNNQMGTVTLAKTEDTFVPYTNIECTIEELVTRRIFYTGNVTLSPEVYNDPWGYYVMYDRCCRNNIITNILSPGETGNVFYLEFPPVVKDGERFVNSSPQLFPPLSDYACANNYYYYDFRGQDADGDSLAYSMTHPLAGFSGRLSPQGGQNPAPYPKVYWAPGISMDAVVPGDPPLSISPDGLLTVKPSQTGLFVFSVLCKEYRSGKKIGEVQRDFQLLVIDCPKPGTKPSLVVKNEAGHSYSDVSDTVFISNNEEKCLEFVVKDSDGLENLTFRAHPVNFTADFNDNFSRTDGHIEQPEDSVTFEFCLPDCQYTPGPHIIDIIAGDGTCPLPLTDTVRLVLFIDPPSNHLAYFETPDVQSIEYQIQEGDSITLTLRGIDEDGDLLNFNVYTPEFIPEEYDMSFSTLEYDSGNMLIRFDWLPNCLTQNLSIRNNFQLFLTIDDLDYCNAAPYDTIVLNIDVELPPNTPPEIYTDLGMDSVTVKVLQTLQLNVLATDADNDPIHVKTIGDGFNLIKKGFTTIDASGVGSLTSIFNWAPTCDMFDSIENESYRVLFLVEDQDKCKIKNGDTLAIQFIPLVPDNNTPVISMPDVPGGQIEIIAGDSLFFSITGMDQDEDSISLYISEGNRLLDWTGAVFNPAKGKSNVDAFFSWQTDCSHLSSNYEGVVYDFTFTLEDDKCFSQASNSIDLAILVKNRQVNYDDFFIPNVFTPNNDGINEFFKVLNLPEDNCNNKFLDVSIYNRFGKKVFFSRDRDFKWAAQNVVSGVFYYILNFSDKDYKGYVHVLY